MTVEAKKVLNDALALPDDQRQRVVEALLDSMPADTVDELEQAWLDEARRRAGKLERGEIAGQDGAQALATLETKLRGMHAQ